MGTEASGVPQAEREPERYELKFALEGLALAPLRARLRLDQSAVRVDHPPRRVQSLYFDTATGSALAENLAGVSERRKLRFRWYGAAADSVQGSLELKLRRNQLGWKERVRVATPLALEGRGKVEFQRALARALPAPWRDRVLGGVEIVQWIAYDREYWVSADRKVRITLDRDLRCYDQRFRARLSRRGASPTPDLVVLELKASREHEAELREIAGRLPDFAGRCSKFVLASSGSDEPPFSYLAR